MSERAKGKSGGIYFKVTDEERRLIEQRMALLGIRNTRPKTESDRKPVKWRLFSACRVPYARASSHCSG